MSVRFFDKIDPYGNTIDEGHVSISTPLIPIKVTHRTSREHERLIIYFQHRNKWVVRLHLETPEELDLLIKRLNKIKKDLDKMPKSDLEKWK